MIYPTEVYHDLNRTLPGLPTAGPGFESIELDPMDVPICSGPAHPRNIHMTTQSLDGEWYCRHCEPERANRARELTLRTVAAVLKILKERRPVSVRKKGGLIR